MLGFRAEREGACGGCRKAQGLWPWMLPLSKPQCTLVGLTTRPELNGARVAVVGYMAERGRYQVRSSSTEMLSVMPEKLRLDAGTAVVACGLEGAAELNGQRGEVVS